MAKLHRRTKSNLLFFLAGALVWALGACSQDPEHGTGSGNFGRGGFSEKITNLDFQSVQTQVLQNKCVQCHARYENYAAVVAEFDDILDSVVTGRMPKDASELTRSEIGILNSWAANGFPYMAGAEPPEQIEMEPYWESISQRVFQPHCTACHSPDGEVPWLDFTNYESVIAKKDELFNIADPRNSYMIEVILDPEEPMPPLESNVRSLSQEQLRVLLDWIGQDLPKEKEAQ